jgi:hypothetical protein
VSSLIALPPQSIADATTLAVFRKRSRATWPLVGMITETSANS